MTTPLVHGDHASNCLDIAQNEYFIDGGFLPQGEALVAAHDEILRLERMATITGDDGTQVYARDVCEQQRRAIETLQNNATHQKRLIEALRAYEGQIVDVLRAVDVWASATGAMDGPVGSANRRLRDRIASALIASTLLANGPHDHDHMEADQEMKAVAEG
jgi:hypothetical protein